MDKDEPGNRQGGDGIMSIEKFLEVLQALITMTNPENEDEVLNARNILKNLFELARSSGMAHTITIRYMRSGYEEFTALLRHREDFAGHPGDFAGNEAKRQRIKIMLNPHC